MKIVINIDDNIYTRLFDNGIDYYDDTISIKTAIRNGIPLPEHHGDLIDRDALIYEQTHHCGYQIPFLLIDEDNLKNVPTIIEADEEESEDNADEDNN